jgi:hypothetical protein
MPTVYTIRIVNHAVDQYEEAQQKVASAEKWLRSCAEDSKRAWDAKEHADLHDVVKPDPRARNIDRRIHETTVRRHEAESELNIAREREQQAMRILCDIALATARGET